MHVPSKRNMGITLCWWSAHPHLGQKGSLPRGNQAAFPTADAVPCKYLLPNKQLGKDSDLHVVFSFLSYMWVTAAPVHGSDAVPGFYVSSIQQHLLLHCLMTPNPPYLICFHRQPGQEEPEGIWREERQREECWAPKPAPASPPCVSSAVRKSWVPHKHLPEMMFLAVTLCPELLTAIWNSSLKARRG